MLISLGSILVSGLIIQFSLNRQFLAYLEQTEFARQKQTVQILAEIYQENGGWFNLQSNLGFGRGVQWGTLRFVTDNHNKAVLTFRHGMMPENQPLTARPIYVNNEKVGTAFFGSNMLQNLLTNQNKLFRRTINRSIIWSILLTGIISLGVAVMFAKRLSTPIMAMNQVAKNMTEGNLDSRVQTLPPDELGELGHSLNQLAEKLQQVEELRKKMTADVAHDLRTPLATVRSHLEGMLDEVIPASKENLASLLEEANRLTLLIQDLQEIASADRTVYQFKKEPLDLNYLLHDLVKKITPLYQSKGVALKLIEFPEMLLYSDQVALEKVLYNLLTNAYKFTPAGKEVELTVELQGSWILIIVSDQGIGISEQDLPFIFERFYRADPSRNRDSGGFGLGLTIVKELVSALGGSVTATSQPMVGSTFTLILPLNKNRETV